MRGLRAFRCVSSGLALLLLVGCPDPVKLETKILVPVAGSDIHGKTDNAKTACILACPPFTKGTGPGFKPAKGQFAIGFEHRYDDGTDPCPCWEYTTYVYRGYAAIKLSDLPANLVTATLLLDVKTFENSSGGSQDGLITGMFRKDEAPLAETGDFDAPLFPGKLTDPVIVPFPATIPPEFPKGGPPVMRQGSLISIDVSVPVLDAVKQGKKFIQFVFVGPNEALQPKTNGVFAALIEPKLKVVFNPKP